jgi:prevent-host-death family protein
MSTCGVTEARARFESLLDEVLAGGEVVITRRGRPIARLVPMDQKAMPLDSLESLDAWVREKAERHRGPTVEQMRADDLL